MQRRIFAEALLTPRGVERHRALRVADGRVLGDEAKGQYDLTAAIVAPGLFDEHLHGSMGYDVMRMDEAGYRAWLMELARRGTLMALPSVYTSPLPVMREALGVISRVMAAQKAGEMGGARVLGVHLEGPFISRGALGAMDADSVLAPSIAAYDELTRGFGDIVRLVTLAPEEAGASELIRELVRRGIRVQAGHSVATCAEGEAAFERGVDGVCHFFNAARGIHHREPSFLTAALLDERVYCECICDGVHVHPSAVRLIYRMKTARRMIAVSDSVKTTALADGDYEDNGETIRVRDGVSRTLGGALNGGGAHLLRAAQNLFGMGVDPMDALRAASLTPAERFGLTEYGAHEGAKAALIGLDDSLNLKWVCLGDQLIAEGKECADAIDRA